MPDFSDYTEEERQRACSLLACEHIDLDGNALYGSDGEEIENVLVFERMENLRLREMLREGQAIIDECQSGYIPGCGEDERFDARKDEWLAGYKKA